MRFPVFQISKTILRSYKEITTKNTRITCMESALMISIGKWEAKSIASLDLPAPVAPMITTIFGFELKFKLGVSS